MVDWYINQTYFIFLNILCIFFYVYLLNLKREKIWQPEKDVNFMKLSFSYCLTFVTIIIFPSRGTFDAYSVCLVTRFITLAVSTAVIHAIHSKCTISTGWSVDKSTITIMIIYSRNDIKKYQAKPAWLQQISWLCNLNSFSLYNKICRLCTLTCM